MSSSIAATSPFAAWPPTAATVGLAVAVAFALAVALAVAVALALAVALAVAVALPLPSLLPLPFLVVIPSEARNPRIPPLTTERSDAHANLNFPQPHRRKSRTSPLMFYPHHMPDLAALHPVPSTESGFCTVVVPCYNEEKRLRLEAFQHFLEQPHPVRLLFVNDGSRDQTLALLQGLKAAHPDHVEVLDLERNGGKAEAVRHGLLYAIARTPIGLCGFWDADLATPLASILEMQHLLEQQPQLEMIFGARVRLLGRSIHRRPVRHYLGRIFATVVSTLLHVPIYDTQCGAKLFRITPDLRHVLARPFHSRWIFDVELLARFLALHPDADDFAHRAIYEYPLPVWQDVAGSRLRPGDFFKSIVELLHIWRTELR